MGSISSIRQNCEEQAQAPDVTLLARALDRAQQFYNVALLNFGLADLASITRLLCCSLARTYKIDQQTLMILGGQTTQPTNYACNQNNNSVGFTLSVATHSAWEPTLNCALQECYSNSSNNNSCILSSTPCYDYRTINNSRFCAPGIICSILEPCDNITYTCTSNTFICVIDSCCSPQAVCLPLSVADFCISANVTLPTTATTSTRTTSTTSTTVSSSTSSKSTTTTSATSSTSTSTKTSTSTTSTKTTTTTTAAAATTTYSCSASIPSSLATLSGSTNTSWTHYAYNYTATKTNPLLMFGVDASAFVYIALDDVSIVDITNSSVQLLTNPSFENSSSTPTGWSIWCSSSCSSSSGGDIISSGCRTNNCYKSQCNGGGALDYLVQEFSAVISRKYTISFWFQRVRIFSSGGSATLYVGIV